MSYSTVTYTGNGATNTFGVPFPYISQSDVQCLVAGVPTAFTWATSSSITFTFPPANGASIYLYRTTSLAVLPASFFDGSTFRASDLNSDFTQILYLAQEAWTRPPQPSTQPACRVARSRP